MMNDTHYVILLKKDASVRTIVFSDFSVFADYEI